MFKYFHGSGETTNLLNQTIIKFELFLSTKSGILKIIVDLKVVLQNSLYYHSVIALFVLHSPLSDFYQLAVL